MNYEGIITAAKQYADRKDVEVTASMDLFIIMVESNVNRVLKTREQTTRAFTPCISDENYYSFPPDFAGMRSIQLNTNSPLIEHGIIPMDYVTPSQMNKEMAKQSSRIVYTIDADQLHIYPSQEDGMTIETSYYQKVPNLNEADTDNWLSESHPDIYISGVCAEIEIFAKNYEAAAIWKSRMLAAIEELGSSDEEELYSGEPLQIRIG